MFSWLSQGSMLADILPGALFVAAIALGLVYFLIVVFLKRGTDEK